LLSASEQTAMVRIPSLLAVRMIRTAISPRLATSTEENMALLCHRRPHKCNRSIGAAPAFVHRHSHSSLEALLPKAARSPAQPSNKVALPGVAGRHQDIRVRLLVSHQHRNRHLLQNRLGNAAKEEFPQPAVMIAAHDDQIGAEIGRAR